MYIHVAAAVVQIDVFKYVHVLVRAVFDKQLLRKQQRQLLCTFSHIGDETYCASGQMLIATLHSK